MAQRVSESGASRRGSVPELMRRHSSLLASLTGEAPRRSSRRQSTSDLEREFPNLRATPRPSTCQSIMEEEPQSLSVEELEQLLDNCTKLTRENQLTEGRLWGLALPQHMPELVKHNSDSAFNFQKVSFGLDAAVQIYSKRVDSMHNAALDTRLRLSTQQKGREVEGGVQEDEGVSARRRARRASEFGGDSTLAANLDLITVKPEAEETVTVDPLFHRTSALFDAGGFRGLPTLNLGIQRGGRYCLDTAEIPDEVVHRGYDLPPGHTLNLDAFGVQFEPIREMKQISPSAFKLYRLLGRSEEDHSIRDLIQRGSLSLMNAVSLEPREDRNLASHEAEENGMPVMDAETEVREGPVEDGFLPEDMPLMDEDGMDEMLVENGNDLPNEESQQGVDGAEIRDGNLLDFTFDTALPSREPTATMDVLDEETLQWLLDAQHDKGGKSRAWTGAAHWKYPQVTTKPSTDKDPEPQPKRREPKTEVDFMHLPETEMSKFKKAEKESAITIQFKENTHFLLPTDYKYNAAFLLQLPLFPKAKPRDWLWRCQMRPQQLGEPGTQMEAGEFPDVGLEQWVDDLGEDGEDFGLDLIQAPPQIQEDTFHVEALPTRVNMGHLKSELWSKIEQLSEQERLPEQIPFEAIVPDLTESLDVSFGLCFACSLHLAVEHSFHIVSTSEGEVSIRLNCSGNE